MGRTGDMASIDLAEQFFLIGHDEFSGWPDVSYELMECGLVGALFGSLIIEGRRGVKEGKVHALDPEPTGEDLADRLVTTVDRQSVNHRVRTWTEQLGAFAYRTIAERLVDSGTLRREAGRKLLGRAGERYPAVNLY